MPRTNFSVTNAVGRQLSLFCPLFPLFFSLHRVISCMISIPYDMFFDYMFLMVIWIGHFIEILYT